MKKLESSLINMVIVLTLIAIIAGGALAYVNDFTDEIIENIKQENLSKGIKDVLLDSTVVISNENIDTIYIEGKEHIDKNIKFIIYKTNSGTAIKTSENAFGGSMNILVGFDNEGVILGYTVLEHAETPGLGAKANTWFQKGQKGNIIGKNPGKDVFKVSKDVEGGIDAITASTITSRAFLLAIENAYKEYFSVGAETVLEPTKQAEAEESKCGNCDKEECGKTDCDGECVDECNEGDCDKQDCKKSGYENKTSCSNENK